jgi:hypothetical protein
MPCRNVTFIIFAIAAVCYDVNMGSITWIILGLVAVGVVIWLVVRSARPSRSRHRIEGATCPKCGSNKVFWAGYSDRKECGKCGKIFS